MNTPFRINRRLLVFLGALLAWTLTGSPGVVAGHQATPSGGAGSYVMAAGSEVTWTAPWVFNEERSFIEDSDQFQMLQFDQDTAVTMVIQGTIPDVENAVELFQGYVGGDPEQRETIDGGAGDPVSYWLDLLPVNGEPHGSFALARSGADAVVTMTVFLAPVNSFADGFASAQAGIAIDGVAAFDGADGAGLQDLLEAAVPAEETAEDSESSLKLGGNDEPAETGSWTDPAHGYDVTWTGEWESSERNDRTLVLASADGSVFINLTGTPANGATTADFAEVQPRLLEDVGVEVGPSATFFDADNFILAGELEGAPFVQEMILIGGGDIAISITVLIDPAADLDDAIAMYRDAVLIAGVVPLDGWETLTL